MIYNFFKRLFDIACSCLGLIFTSPIWLITVIGIKLSDPGAVFYIANRVGKNNDVFKMYKFRSMYQTTANESVFRGEESRIFPFGKFIRATKIDELPQLINILNGTMSIVGPRPAAVDQLDAVRSGKYIKASEVAAGLTGPSALYDYIYGDSIESEEEYITKVLPTRLDLDVFYVENRSWHYDLKMIIYTVLCILCTVFKIKPEFIYNELVRCAALVAESDKVNI
ncbi:MAG: sugar transferase [Ruminococcaceae bacterium]|nr:sugar transferase [Oscillospiraceae bacterium]